VFFNMQRKKQKHSDLFRSFGIPRAVAPTHGEHGATQQPTTVAAAAPADEPMVIDDSDDEQPAVQHAAAVEASELPDMM
jgi:hypothetical protein